MDVSAAPREERDSGAEKVAATPLQPLDANVLGVCGRLVVDRFRRFVKNETSGDDDDTDVCDDSDDSYDTVSTGFSDTYMDLAARQTFDRLYDTMSPHLESVDCGHRGDEAPPSSLKLRLYDDLGDFVARHRKLHEINRYVFGDGPSGDWEPHTADALNAVRTWRIRYQDDIDRVPDSLIGTYEAAAANPDLNPSDVAMVAFAVFAFLLGYDTSVDFELMYSMLCDVEAVHRPADFRLVRNRALRHARAFLYEHGTDGDREFLETLAEGADFAALCEWTFDLTAGRPGVVERLTSNPFTVDVPVHGVDGTRMAASQVVRLRIFHRWISRELFVLLSHGAHPPRRISLLDDHVQRCLCCFSRPRSWSRLFDDAYAHVLLHLTEVLVEHDCPDRLLETLHGTWHRPEFQSLVRLCVRKLVARNSELRYRDSSTDSNDDDYDCSSSSGSGSRSRSGSGSTLE